jgi:hypothetical protein
VRHLLGALRAYLDLHRDSSTVFDTTEENVHNFTYYFVAEHAFCEIKGNHGGDSEDSSALEMDIA